MKFVQRLMLVGFLVLLTVLTAACTKKRVTQDEMRPAVAEAEATKPPAAVESEEMVPPPAVEAEEAKPPAAVETEKMVQPPAVNSEKTKEQASAETEEIEQLAALDSEESKEQASVKSEEMVPPPAVDAEETKQPEAVEDKEKEQPPAVEVEEKKLKATLELWDGQDGIVGMLGYVWTIEPSGAWRVAHFVNDRISEPVQEGQLTPEELAFLIEILDSQSFDELPRRLQVGKLLADYARMISLNLVDLKETTLFFKAGEHPETPSSVQSRITLTRFAKIVRTIKDLTKVGSHEPEWVAAR